MKVLIYTHDPMLTLCYLPDEVIELFGLDRLNEDGCEIPDSLATEIQTTYKKLCSLSQQLKAIKITYDTVD